MKPEIVLRKLELDDLPKVAEVHIGSFPDSALTKLGTKVVQHYYLWQLTGPHEKVWAVGAFVGENCAGFAVSGVFNGSASGFVHQNRAFLIKKVLLHPWLLFNPLFLKRTRLGVKLLKRYSKKKKPAAKIPTQNAPLSFGILSIAVSVDFQKLGIGKMLMLDAEGEAVRCGYRQMDLTVHPDNRQAVEFYETQNWQKILQKDSWRGVMIKRLETDEVSVAPIVSREIVSEFAPKKIEAF